MAATRVSAQKLLRRSQETCAHAILAFSCSNLAQIEPEISAFSPHISHSSPSCSPPKVIFSTQIEMPECVCLMRGSGGSTRCTACFHPRISFSFRKGQHRKLLESPRKGKQWILGYRPDQGSFRGIPSEDGFEKRSKLQICNWSARRQSSWQRTRPQDLPKEV
jgi:hypothetical protein